MRMSGTARALALVPILVATAAAQAPAVGDPAPSFALDTWLNLTGKDAPTSASLAGRAVAIEFWGTW